MKGWRRALVAGGMLGALGACGGDGPPAPWTHAPHSRIDLRGQVSATTVSLLQPITVTLDRWRAEGAEVEFTPAVPATDFATTTIVRPEVPFLGGHWQRTVLTCRPLRGPGELTLPSFVVKLRDGSDAASAPEVAITVTSALGGAGMAIEAPGEPFPTPFGGWWWIAAMAALLLAGACWWRWHRARPRGQAASEVAVPPHTKALRALQRLRGESRTTSAQIEAFYVEVSQVLRVYVEERFGLRAPERTTEEFLRELDGDDGPLHDHRQALERFLLQCDLVKFAAVRPDADDHLATWDAAVAFVEATRADRQPAGAGA